MDICPSESTGLNAKAETTPVDQQSKILCNVVVRATHELHANQRKSRNEIQIFLKKDCQKLSTPQLAQKVKNKRFRRKINL